MRSASTELEVERERARILVVDDEPDLVWVLQQSLGEEGYRVLAAYDGAQAIKLMRRYHPDLVVLDILMPGLDGLQVCHTLSQDPTLSSLPILFLSARDGIEDRVKGLDEGGDDYLVKPFDLRELKARVRALLRRAQPSSETPIGRDTDDSMMVLGDLVLDKRACRLHLKGETIQLTRVEFQLLHFLMTHAGEVFSSRKLLHEVWDYPDEASDTSVVRCHIRNLRTKMEPDPSHPVYIRTIPRHGYILEERPAKP